MEPQFNLHWGQQHAGRDQISPNDIDHYYSPRDLHRLAVDSARSMSRNRWARAAADAVRNNPALAAVGVGGVALVAAPVLVVAPLVAAVNCVGFGAGGIVASTFAAAAQAAIGNVAAGSIFAWTTSLGAGGYAAASVAGAAQVVGGVAAGAGAVAVSKKIQR